MIRFTMSVAKINDIYPGVSLKKIIRMASKNKEPFRMLALVITLNCFTDCAITIKKASRCTKKAFASTANAISLVNKSVVAAMGRRRVITKANPMTVTLNAVGISSKKSFKSFPAHRISKPERNPKCRSPTYEVHKRKSCQ